MSEVEIPDVVRNITDKMKKAGAKVGTGGVIEAPEKSYEASLEGTDLDMKTVEKVQKHNINFISATALLTGELGTSAMKKDKKLDQVSVSIPVGKDTVSASFQRSKEVPVNAPGEPRKTSLKYGVTNSSYTVWGAGNRGTLKKVRQHLSEEAARVLGS